MQLENKIDGQKLRDRFFHSQINYFIEFQVRWSNSKFSIFNL